MSRTMLLVEDDAGIAAMLEFALGRWGYRVLHASGASAAIEVAKANRNEIGVVLCDVVLPDGPGPEALGQIQRYCPRARVVFTSGYPFDVLTERGLISSEMLREMNAQYLPKPFLPRDVHTLAGAAFHGHDSEQGVWGSGAACARMEAYAGISY